MNKIIIDKEEIIKVEDNIEIIFNKDEDKEIYLLADYNSYDITIRIASAHKLCIHHYSIDSSFNIKILLEQENSQIEYYYSCINYNDNNYVVDIYHNYKNTKSKVISHGVNINDKKLVFDINPKVLKETDGCFCIQENNIINLNNGYSIIKPNLLIDNYDVLSSHSAYIGKFKDDIIFYLMSRGLSRKHSYELLIKSFLINSRNVLYDRIDNFIKEINKI